jgi:hypothetical protein
VAEVGRQPGYVACGFDPRVLNNATDSLNDKPQQSVAGSMTTDYTNLKYDVTEISDTLLLFFLLKRCLVGAM